MYNPKNKRIHDDNKTHHNLRCLSLVINKNRANNSTKLAKQDVLSITGSHIHHTYITNGNNTIDILPLCLKIKRVAEMLVSSAIIGMVYNTLCSLKTIVEEK